MDACNNKILQIFLRTIEIISDKEYQKRVWILGMGPECYDFDEAACDLADEADDILEHPKDYELTETQYRLLLQFKNAFDACDKGPTPFTPEVIESAEWKNIMQRARELLIAFNYQRTSP